MLSVLFLLYLATCAGSVWWLFWRLGAETCPRCGKVSDKHGKVPATGYGVCVRCEHRWPRHLENYRE